MQTPPVTETRASGAQLSQATSISPLAETVKIALFGANQSGKTLQIGNLIQTFGAQNVGIVSCEDGLKTVSSLIDPAHVKECNGIGDLKAAWKWAAEKYAGPDKWACVDGGTRAMQWIAGEVWAGTDACYTRLALGDKKTELPIELRPFLRFITKEGEIDGQRQWIQIGRDIDWEINRWVKMPANMFWTFWEDQTSLDQYRKGLPWQVDCPGKAGRDAVYGAFDFVLRLTRGGEKVVASHDSARRVVRSKTRDDWKGGIKVPNEIGDFNLARFVTETLKRKETR